jgi:hypothetical protein
MYGGVEQDDDGGQQILVIPGRDYCHGDFLRCSQLVVLQEDRATWVAQNAGGWLIRRILSFFCFGQFLIAQANADPDFVGRRIGQFSFKWWQFISVS